jgi:YesN/AraC family two-component response regulator
LNYIAFEVNTVSELDDAILPLLTLADKYRSSSLKGIEEIKLFERLKNLLEEEKFYLNPVLSLKGMADRLATNTKYLSQVVNHQTSYNFQQFINLYRVDEAKKKILSNTFSNLTLYGVALQCGFKNKSTFYKVFKEVTGHTPKEFIKNQDTSNKTVES